MVKSARIDIVTDIQNFPYFRVSFGQLKLNFAKQEDVLDFIQKHMVIDGDKPVTKIVEKEKPKQETGVVQPTSDSKTRAYNFGNKTRSYNKNVAQQFLELLETCPEGVTFDEAAYTLSTTKFVISQAAYVLEQNQKIARANPGHRPIKWKKVRVDELSR